MHTILLFAILGLGTGAAYAIVGLGVVLIQKGSGLLNFAQGGIAAIAAFTFAHNVGAGTPKAVSLIIVVGGCAVGGALFYVLIMRPLRTSPLLARLVASLGLLVALQGLAILIWGVGGGDAPSLFPTKSVSMLGVSFGEDRLWLLGVTILLAVGLWALYSFTIFGMATRATAESERGASLLGFSPDLIAGTNWAMGSALAGLAGIFIAPISGLNSGTLSLLILPALAAALIGRFSSFGITALVGIGIGIAQSLLTRYWTQTGINDALPFIIVVIAMVLTGKLIPPRGTLALARPPLAPGSRFRLGPAVALIGGAVVLVVVFSSTYQSAMTTTFIVAISALSVVLITGFVGQMSLMPMTFAGIGALLVSKFAHNWGIPFPWPILMAVVVTVPIGVLLGLPALRVRGLNLAVVTIGAAVAVNAMLFLNSDWTGGYGGSPVPIPGLFSFSLDPVSHPVRFALFALLVTIAVTVAVLNLRQSAFGRRMLAVRGNERAAASSGINVSATKLQAFALSSGLAALSGALLSYQLGAVSFERFSPMASITLVTLVYIGGIATVYGALVAGVAASGGVIFVLMSSVGSLVEYYAVISGLSLLVTVLFQPDGLVIAWQEQARWVRTKLLGGSAGPPTGGASGDVHAVVEPRGGEAPLVGSGAVLSRADAGSEPRSA